MTRGTIAALAGVLTAGAVSILSAQGAPDLILSNGKIITVDERFTIAQAVAIRGDQVVAVGTNQEIDRLAGAGARRIDLRGRAVIPGLIDNHMHLLRYGTTWRYEVRWEELRQRGTKQAELDPSKLNSLAFLVRPEDTPYDVWIDDLRFVRR